MSWYKNIKWKLEFHVTRKIKRIYREKWWVRAVTLLLVLATAVFLNEFVRRELTSIPWPVRVETPPSPFAAISAHFRQQELIIENPNLSTETLLSYSGRRNEVLDVHCTSGHLTADTVEWYRKMGAESLPPAGDQRIDFVEQPASGSAKPLPDDKQTCTTTMSVSVVPGARPPSKVHFFQSYEAGSDQQRILEMMADADLKVNINTIPPSDNPDDSECLKLLQVGKWELPHEQGMFKVNFIAPAGSKLLFIFKPFDGRSSLQNKGDFQPLDFGDHPLQAQIVSINSLTEAGPIPSSSPVASAQAFEAGSPLAIGNLAVGAEQIQLSVSGKGVVQTGGEYASNFLEHANNRYKILALLFVMIDAAFVAWWLRQISRLFFSENGPLSRIVAPRAGVSFNSFTLLLIVRLPLTARYGDWKLTPDDSRSNATC